MDWSKAGTLGTATLLMLAESPRYISAGGVDWLSGILATLGSVAFGAWLFAAGRADKGNHDE